MQSRLQDKRIYRAKNREEVNRWAREQYKRDREKILPKMRERANLRTRRLKQEMIEAYGGKCVCCGEAHWEMLTVDHINGGGRAHLTSIGLKWGGSNFYKWLKKQGYPKDDFRLLCYNCNCVRGHYGYCPHERESS